MKKAQQGFTLIELVMVIVILGVLAAVAIPKFIDLKGDASAASVSGVAGALSSASAINYAVYAAKGTGVAGSGKALEVKSCADAGALLQGGAFPTSGGVFSTTPTGAVFADLAGTSKDCTLQFKPTSGNTSDASFTTISVQ